MQNKQKVYTLLPLIPKGKVTTYKALAQKAGIKNPRTVGKILHQNKNPEIYPCYKVVRSDGKITTGYAYGGQTEQIVKLISDGIEVVHKNINLKKYLFSF